MALRALGTHRARRARSTRFSEWRNTAPPVIAPLAHGHIAERRLSDQPNVGAWSMQEWLSVRKPLLEIKSTNVMNKKLSILAVGVASCLFVGISAQAQTVIERRVIEAPIQEREIITERVETPVFSGRAVSGTTLSGRRQFKSNDALIIPDRDGGHATIQDERGTREGFVSGAGSIRVLWTLTAWGISRTEAATLGRGIRPHANNVSRGLHTVSLRLPRGVCCASVELAA